MSVSVVNDGSTWSGGSARPLIRPACTSERCFPTGYDGHAAPLLSTSVLVWGVPILAPVSAG